MGESFSLKAPSLPSKPLQDTFSRYILNGRAYAAAGQAVASLHTSDFRLQAYQADLLKDLDKAEGLSPDEVAGLCRTTDMALSATK